MHIHYSCCCTHTLARSYPPRCRWSVGSQETLHEHFQSNSHTTVGCQPSREVKSSTNQPARGAFSPPPRGLNVLSLRIFVLLYKPCLQQRRGPGPYLCSYFFPPLQTAVPPPGEAKLLLQSPPCPTPPASRDMTGTCTDWGRAPR
ncbi:unnamed protein product [Ectocarpus sp. 12 AP-2014]